ncbi:hypothetical protein PV392_16470 [Streptomyces sp. ME03-5709C]|nr:hypothetical protein [Streptomyces sp. ME03-5709C]
MSKPSKPSKPSRPANGAVAVVGAGTTVAARVLPPGRGGAAVPAVITRHPKHVGDLWAR